MNLQFKTKIKTFFFFFCFLILRGLVLGNNTPINSIEKIQKEVENKSVLDILTVANSYSYKDFKLSLAYANCALQKAKQQNRPLYIVTADKIKVTDFFTNQHHYQLPVLTCDATAIKTAARVNPTVFSMKGPVVQGKWSWKDIGDAVK